MADWSVSVLKLVPLGSDWKCDIANSMNVVTENWRIGWSFNAQPAARVVNQRFYYGSCAECWPQLFKTSARSRRACDTPTCGSSQIATWPGWNAYRGELLPCSEHLQCAVQLVFPLVWRPYCSKTDSDFLCLDLPRFDPAPLLHKRCQDWLLSARQGALCYIKLGEPRSQVMWIIFIDMFGKRASPSWKDVGAIDHCEEYKSPVFHTRWLIEAFLCWN